MLKRIRKSASLENVLGCDLRSLALLRVTIAIVLLADWFNRLTNFTAFHSEMGLFPRQALLDLYGNPYIWSLHHIATGDWWPATLMVVQFFCILGLLIGWRTRLFTILCWILQLSVQARNPILMQSGDVLLRIILFWGMFLPWGGKYSVDSALSQTPKPQSVFTYATIGVCLQALYVYFFSVFLKNGSQWRESGTAVYYALNLDHFSTDLGKWMLTLPLSVLQVFNYSVLTYEFLAPILFLLPWGHKWLRPLLILGFWFMHLGFGATLAIGNFVLISIASTMPFIPSVTWDWLESKLSRPKGVVAFYDQDCGFCIKMVAIVREFLLLPKDLFKPAQSDKKVEEFMLKENSWVFQDQNGNLLTRSSAFRELLGLSSVFYWAKWLFLIPGVTFIGDLVYRRIAAHRSRTCDPHHPPLSAPSPVFNLTGVESYFLAFVVVIVTLWNIGSMPGSQLRAHLYFNNFMLLTRLEQRWEMFAPFPMTDDGWFIIKGKLRNEQEVDLFRNGAPIVYEKPESVKDMYEDFRWRKYMVNLWAASYSRYRQYYSRYLCRTWNAAQPYEKQVLNFEIIYMKEDTPLPGQPLPKPVEMNIWKWNCY